MNIFNRRLFLITIAILSGAMVFAFKKINRKIVPSANASAVSDTTTTFQTYITKYSQLLLSKDSCEFYNEQINKDIIRTSSRKDSLVSVIKSKEKSILDEKSDSSRKAIKKLVNEYRTVIENLKEKIDSVENISHSQQLKLTKLDKECEVELKLIRSISKKITGSNTIKFKGTDYSVFIVNMDQHEIKMHWNVSAKHGYSSIGDVVNYLKNYQEVPVMVTNGGMYKMNFEPQGLFIDDCLEKFHIDLSKPNSDNFYLKPNGVFYIDSKNIPHIDSSEEFKRLYVDQKYEVKYATQSGPMLLVNGQIHRQFTPRSRNQKIRSGVGIIDNKHVVFAISDNEVNFYDFAQLYQAIFNCRNALFLDGAISRMYLSDINSEELGGQFGPMISVRKKIIN